MIALRKSIPALAQISPANLKKSSIPNEKVVSFIRPHKNGDVLVIQNITNENVEVLVKERIENVFFSMKGSNLDGQKVKLGAYEVIILEIE
jgi:hypothetical protein